MSYLDRRGWLWFSIAFLSIALGIVRGGRGWLCRPAWQCWIRLRLHVPSLLFSARLRGLREIVWLRRRSLSVCRIRRYRTQKAP